MKNKFTALLMISLLSLCACEEDVPGYAIHTEIQANYLLDDYNQISRYTNGEVENSRPLPYKIDSSIYERETLVSTYENDKLIDSFVCNDQKEHDIYNLKIGIKYNVNATLNGQVVNSYTFSIENSAPRNLFIDGVTNCRDLGGWKIDKKHRVKQGLIYRTAKYNEDESDTLLVTEDGINTLKTTLGIKTEIDLRKTSDNENGGIVTSPLGEGVNYISLPMASSGNVLTLNKTKIGSVLDVFADESNYPIAFHCSIGTDRTGLIAFLINSLLGVSKDDLCRDYLFSNFALINGVRTAKTINGYIESIDIASGKSLSEKTYNYLVSIGVKETTLNKIKEIMIEKL